MPYTGGETPEVGDLFMSLIYTCQLCGAKPPKTIPPSKGQNMTIQWHPVLYTRVSPGSRFFSI